MILSCINRDQTEVIVDKIFVEIYVYLSSFEHHISIVCSMAGYTKSNGKIYTRISIFGNMRLPQIQNGKKVNLSKTILTSSKFGDHQFIIKKLFFGSINN